VSFEPTPRGRQILERLRAFMAAGVVPAEATFFRQLAAGESRWRVPPVLEELKGRAREAGLWNLFLPDPDLGAGLTNLDYAPLAEEMGRVVFAAEVFNCSAPDTGNMEVLHRWGSGEQRQRWLRPLLAGEIRSCFAMTEPEVASSDATNLEAEIRREGDEYLLTGRKWWVSGGGDPRCRVALFLGRSNPEAPRHRRHSMVLVPMDWPGVVVERLLPVFGYDHAPHGHAQVLFDRVRVPAGNLIGAEGQGFEIAQGRLGPGRIHHCMRSIGIAERALEDLCRRVTSRVAFGRPLAEQGTIRAGIARSRLEIDQARLLTLHAAHRLDTVGARGARAEIAAIKVVAPQVALAVLDRAIQAHGGAGVSDDFTLAAHWANVRTLRIADGPDEVHLEALARLELARYVPGEAPAGSRG
jgi:acyl-CoA dehydrogenase